MGEGARDSPCSVPSGNEWASSPEPPPNGGKGDHSSVLDGQRQSRGIQWMGTVISENSSHSGCGSGIGKVRGRGRGRRSHSQFRPSREELVRLYLLRKRGIDKKCPDTQVEVDPPPVSAPPVSAREVLPDATAIDLAKPPGEPPVSQMTTRARPYYEDEQDRPPPKRLRNRVKAQKARERKMAQLRNLEGKMKELERKNVELEDQCSALQRDNEMLREEIIAADPSGREELMHYYEGLKKETKEVGVEFNENGLLHLEDGDTLDTKTADFKKTQLDNGEPYVGMRFDSEKCAREFYAEYAWHVGFSIRTDKCRRSERDGAIIWRKLVCSKEGFTRVKERSDEGKSRRSRPSTRTGCPAFIEVARKTDDMWTVTKFHKEHNHNMLFRENDQWELSNTRLEENDINGVANTELNSEAAQPSMFRNVNDEPCTGMIFKSEETARVFYNRYSRRKGFVMRTDKYLCSGEDGLIIWRRFTCSKEGLSRTMEGRDDWKLNGCRLSLRTGCLALMEVTRRTEGKWEVTKFEGDHNHMLLSSGKENHLQINKPLFDGKWHAEDDFSSYLEKILTKETNGNDVRYLLAYVKYKQEKDHAFFYEMQSDKNDQIYNLLWVDASAQRAYSAFGDVVMFESPYKDDSRMPFAVFSGVNHHRQRVVLGCAFMMYENEETLKWLFRTWLKAMNGNHPVSVVTDLDSSLQEAVSEELPNTRHRFSHWYILRRCKLKLPGLYVKNSAFKKVFRTCINHSETPEEFEIGWEEIVEKYDLGENEWICELHRIRRQWVPVYQRDCFFAELNTSEKPESIERIFGGSMHPGADLHQFLVQYERAVGTLYAEEMHADSMSIDTMPRLRTHSPLELQASRAYTNEVFEMFQEQFADALAYKVINVEEGHDGVSTYSLDRYIKPSIPCVVKFKASERMVSCSCRKFEFSGILCAHVLAVLLAVQNPTLPDQYILKRWTKMAGTIQGQCSKAVEQDSY